MPSLFYKTRVFCCVRLRSDDIDPRRPNHSGNAPHPGADHDDRNTRDELGPARTEDGRGACGKWLIRGEAPRTDARWRGVKARSTQAARYAAHCYATSRLARAESVGLSRAEPRARGTRARRDLFR